MVIKYKGKALEITSERLESLAEVLNLIEVKKEKRKSLKIKALELLTLYPEIIWEYKGKDLTELQAELEKLRKDRDKLSLANTSLFKTKNIIYTRQN